MTAIAYPLLRPHVAAAEATNARGPRLPLLLWIGAEVTVATTVFVIVAAAVPLRRDIALPWPGLPPIVALAAGLCFWLALGLLGGSRSEARAGGSVMTFNLPFIVGGTILGGPLAGALLGLVAEVELREIRGVPWYGVLANHAVAILSAVAAGLVGEVLRGPIDGVLPGQPALALFIVSAAIAVAYTTVNVLLVIPGFAFKDGESLAEASRRTYDPSFRDTALVEGLLAWLLAATYLVIGWWATIACVALVTVAWRARELAERGQHDPMTGLLNDSGFAPLFDTAIDAARLGRRALAYLALDLDGLWETNQRYGSAAGDQLLKAAAARIKQAVRAADLVARKVATGDEFIVLLDAVDDLATALRIAERIQVAVARPISLRGQHAGVQLSTSIAIGVVVIERGTDLTAMDVRQLGERRLEASKCRDGEVVADGNGPTEAEAERRRRRKDIQRNGWSDHGRAGWPNVESRGED